MASRRMFDKELVSSDYFLDMPLSVQALYFHLSMRADDDGFINNPNKIKRMIGCNSDDLTLLIAKSFIIPFDSGIVVIKHWKMHNYIQKDRYKPTIYNEEKQQLEIKKNGSYTLKKTESILLESEPINELDTKCIQEVYTLDTQVRLGKVSIGKNSIDKNSKDKDSLKGKESSNYIFDKDENIINTKTGEVYDSNDENIDQSIFDEALYNYNNNDTRINNNEEQFNNNDDNDDDNNFDIDNIYNSESSKSLNDNNLEDEIALVYET